MLSARHLLAQQGAETWLLRWCWDGCRARVSPNSRKREGELLGLLLPGATSAAAVPGGFNTRIPCTLQPLGAGRWQLALMARLQGLTGMTARQHEYFCARMCLKGPIIIPQQLRASLAFDSPGQKAQSAFVSPARAKQSQGIFSRGVFRFSGPANRPQRGPAEMWLPQEGSVEPSPSSWPAQQGAHHWVRMSHAFTAQPVLVTALGDADKKELTLPGQNPPCWSC